MLLSDLIVIEHSNRSITQQVFTEKRIDWTRLYAHPPMVLARVVMPADEPVLQLGTFTVSSAPAQSSISYPLRKSLFSMALAVGSPLIVWVTASHSIWRLRRMAMLLKWQVLIEAT
jgi:hypothetical protein